jgi:hypothetical protein
VKEIQADEKKTRKKEVEKNARKKERNAALRGKIGLAKKVWKELPIVFDVFMIWSSRWLVARAVQEQLAGGWLD